MFVNCSRLYSSWLSLPLGGKVHENSRCESKNVTFLKSALNHVLTLQNARARRELSIDVLYVTRASICVELWSFYCRKRISVSMSYISFWKHISYDTLGLRSEGYPCGPPTLKTKVGRVPLPKLGMTLIRVPTVFVFEGFTQNGCPHVNKLFFTWDSTQQN